MSETFYIKKTAFDDNNFDLTQRETDSFIIGPGELNGPAGLARDSDLELYGFGSLKWGEGVDQNQYRLMESSACPAKEDFDFLAGGADGNDDFRVATHGIVPKSEEDLGIGNGITKPLIGQIWYNTSNNILYNNELTGWETVFKEVTDVLTDHAANTDLHLGSPQNIFLDALDLPTLLASEVNELIGMGSTQGITTVQGQLDLMVELAGDTMTGNLIVGDGATADAVTVRAAGGNAHYWLRRSDNTTAGIFYANISGDDLRIQKYNLAGAPTATLILTDDGNVSINGSQSLTANKLTRVDYVQNFLDRRIDQSMTSGRSITFSGGGEIRGLPLTPNAQTDAASKDYVDTKTASVNNSNEYHLHGENFNLTIPTNVSIIYVSGSGGGQGGQGGGDATNIGTAATPGAGGASWVSTNLEVLYFAGAAALQDNGSSPDTIIQTPRPWAYYRRSGINYDLLTMSVANSGSNNIGDTGGRGGDSFFGRGGFGGTGPVGTGGAGTKGGGGGGGGGQDGWGGSGGGAGGNGFSIPLRVSPGTTVSIRTGSGSSGTTNNLRGTGGRGGAGYIIISW